MKYTIRLIGGLCFAAIIAFASCKKKSYSNTDQLANLGTATISGKVWARLVDTIGANDTQYAPTTTVITAWLDSKELLYYFDSGQPYAHKTYTANVMPDGSYSFVVSVSKYRPATLHIEPADFTYSLLRKNVPHDSLYTVSKKYTSPSFSLLIGNDSNIVQDIHYVYP